MNARSKLHVPRTVIGLVACLALAACAPRNSADFRPPKRAIELNNRAVRAFMDAQPERALSLVDEAIVVAPKFYHAYVNKAGILEKMGRATDAIATLEEALTVRPDAPAVYVPLGALLEKSGRKDEAYRRYEEAQSLYIAAVKKSPDDADVAVGLAIAYLLRDDRDAALSALDDFLSRNPNNERVNEVRTKMQSNPREAFLEK